MLVVGVVLEWVGVVVWPASQPVAGPYCGSPEIVEGSLCCFSGEGGVLVVVR